MSEKVLFLPELLWKAAGMQQPKLHATSVFIFSFVLEKDTGLHPNRRVGKEQEKEFTDEIKYNNKQEATNMKVSLNIV